MGDCLYECLKEAHLEKYYRNFTLNGLTNCEALIELSMQQYADYGIVAMDDRLKLFKLIQIVKSVQAEGISCQHEGHHKAHKTELGNKTANLHHKQNQGAVRRLPDNPENLHHKHNAGVVHRVPHLQERVSAGHGINPRPHASNANFLNNYQEQQNVLLRQGHVLHPAHNHHVAPPVARKTRSRTAHDPAHSNVVFRSGSDSPVFQCKKTLNFDDSNLDSSDEEIPPEKPKPAEEHPALISAKPNITQVPKPVPAQVHVENKAQERFFPDAKTLQNESNFVHLVDNAQPEAPTQINGIPLQYVPRSFFIEVENGSNKTVQSVPNAHVREPNVNGVINFEDLPAQSLTKQQMMYTAQAQDAHRAASNFHSGVKPFHFKKFQSDTESKNDHAYFPKKTKERDPHVETVYNTGYNYGLPLSPQKSRVRTKSLDKIRVCVRKRPLVPREVKRGETDVVKVLNKNTVAVEEDKVSVDLTKFVQQHMFSFDEVFNDDSTNEDVYKRSVKPLLDCIFKRGTATCFAFGQTGSGKSYTLLGTKSIPGLYQLAGKDILKAMGAGETSGGRHLWVSYYEIYCSQLYDLLNKKKKLHVRENGKQRVCIAGLMETEITDIKNLIEVVNYGNLVRSTGTSGVNPQSSRSHAVLQLELRDGSDTRTGRLSFIDLAGSERASDVTAFNRQTRMEGAEINQSLLALKECIRSLDQEQKHTPYRQSKLTHILRDSFTSAGAHTVMIANVAPSQSACENTLNTLRYADRVKELQKPHSATKTPTSMKHPTPLNSVENKAQRDSKTSSTREQSERIKNSSQASKSTTPKDTNNARNRTPQQNDIKLARSSGGSIRSRSVDARQSGHSSDYAQQSSVADKAWSSSSSGDRRESRTSSHQRTDKSNGLSNHIVDSRAGVEQQNHVVQKGGDSQSAAGIHRMPDADPVLAGTSQTTPANQDATAATPKKLTPPGSSSVFNPNHIQYASTPIKHAPGRAGCSPPGGPPLPLDLSKLMSEAHDSPIRGHRLPGSPRGSGGRSRAQQPVVANHQVGGGTAAGVHRVADSGSSRSGGSTDIGGSSGREDHPLRPRSRSPRSRASAETPPRHGSRAGEPSETFYPRPRPSQETPQRPRSKGSVDTPPAPPSPAQRESILQLLQEKINNGDVLDIANIIRKQRRSPRGSSEKQAATPSSPRASAETSGHKHLTPSSPREAIQPRMTMPITSSSSPMREGGGQKVTPRSSQDLHMSSSARVSQELDAMIRARDLSTSPSSSSSHDRLARSSDRGQRSAGGHHLARSHEQIMDGHNKILEHLDNVLDKAKSVITVDSAAAKSDSVTAEKELLLSPRDKSQRTSPWKLTRSQPNLLHHSGGGSVVSNHSEDSDSHSNHSRLSGGGGHSNQYNHQRDSVTNSNHSSGSIYSRHHHDNNSHLIRNKSGHSDVDLHRSSQESLGGSSHKSSHSRSSDHMAPAVASRTSDCNQSEAGKTSHRQQQPDCTCRGVSPAAKMAELAGDEIMITSEQLEHQTHPVLERSAKLNRQQVILKNLLNGEIDGALAATAGGGRHSDPAPSSRQLSRDPPGAHNNSHTGGAAAAAASAGSEREAALLPGADEFLRSLAEVKLARRVLHDNQDAARQPLTKSKSVEETYDNVPSSPDHRPVYNRQAKSEEVETYDNVPQTHSNNQSDSPAARPPAAESAQPPLSPDRPLVTRPLANMLESPSNTRRGGPPEQLRESRGLLRPKHLRPKSEAFLDSLKVLGMEVDDDEGLPSSSSSQAAASSSAGGQRLSRADQPATAAQEGHIAFRRRPRSSNVETRRRVLPAVPTAAWIDSKSVHATTMLKKLHAIDSLQQDLQVKVQEKRKFTFDINMEDIAKAKREAGVGGHTARQQQQPATDSDKPAVKRSISSSGAGSSDDRSANSSWADVLAQSAGSTHHPMAGVATGGGGKRGGVDAPPPPSVPAGGRTSSSDSGFATHRSKPEHSMVSGEVVIEAGGVMAGSDEGQHSDASTLDDVPSLPHTQEDPGPSFRPVPIHDVQYVKQAPSSQPVISYPKPSRVAAAGGRGGVVAGSRSEGNLAAFSPQTSLSPPGGSQLRIHRDSAFTKVCEVRVSASLASIPGVHGSRGDVAAGYDPTNTQHGHNTGVRHNAVVTSSSSSPVKTEKLGYGGGGCKVTNLFSPIHPFPSMSGHAITVPSVVTKATAAVHDNSNHRRPKSTPKASAPEADTSPPALRPKSTYSHPTADHSSPNRSKPNIAILREKLGLEALDAAAAAEPKTNDRKTDKKSHGTEGGGGQKLTASESCSVLHVNGGSGRSEVGDSDKHSGHKHSVAATSPHKSQTRGGVKHSADVRQSSEHTAAAGAAAAAAKSSSSKSSKEERRASSDFHNSRHSNGDNSHSCSSSKDLRHHSSSELVVQNNSTSDSHGKSSENRNAASSEDVQTKSSNSKEGLIAGEGPASSSKAAAGKSPARRKKSEGGRRLSGDGEAQGVEKSPDSSKLATASTKAQNLLILAHEDQLSEITGLCKQEMKLLMGVKSNTMDFTSYMKELDKLLSSKSRSIETLKAQLGEFHNQSPRREQKH